MRREFPLNKIKIIALGLLSMAFVALGFFIIGQPEDPDFILKSFIGWTSIVFFGLISGIYIVLISKNNLGLIMDEEGIIDHTTFMSVGRIYWKDIMGFTKEQMLTNHFIIIHLYDPALYLSKTSPWKRFFLKSTQQKYGSPIAINGNFLKENVNQITYELQEELDRRKKL
ncbi:MAG: hypothetical protein RLZZ500_216 [Bacteroidota bacterium]|jgi:hypothetical protein